MSRDAGLSVRLPRGLVARLDKAADERMISRNKLIELLIEDGLNRLVPVADLLAAADEQGRR